MTKTSEEKKDELNPSSVVSVLKEAYRQEPLSSEDEDRLREEAEGAFDRAVARISVRKASHSAPS
jgi:hypothetical protein